ncbi:MAG: helix-turn-helix transcriptional regulator [Clostridia bacterium]|nr:helix-turn-helix transcriptional regulator [Clostridia bacterium]
MDFDVEKFSYRLTVLLDENNMTQTQLAKKIGTSNVTICRYLTCERIPRLDVVTKIASVFNISLDYLLGLSDDKDIQVSDEISDLNIALLISKLYSLDDNSHLSKNQIELIKKNITS